MDMPKSEAEAEQLHDAGLLNVSDFLYVLRNEAGRAADKLSAEVVRMRQSLARAEDVLARLNNLADSAERAAEREVQGDE